METNAANEHLQVIRTLMERSALYRRELAPIMLSAGTLGTGAAVLGLALRLDSMMAFAGLWLTTAVAAVAGAFLIARRQAFKDSEPFWSPPTRRVAQALCPPLAVGLVFGLMVMGQASRVNMMHLLAVVWAILYGLALYSAGFFIPRGVRWLGAGYMVAALLYVIFFSVAGVPVRFSAHWEMGCFFGVPHLAYGVYLRLTATTHPA